MNKNFAIIQVAYRNIFRSKRRSFFSIFAVALSVMFIVGMNSIFDGEFEDKALFMQRLFLGHIEVVSSEFTNKNDDYSIQYPLDIKEQNIIDTVKLIEANPDVDRAFQRISTGVSLDNVHKKTAVLWGIDIDKELDYHNFNAVGEVDGLEAGRFPTNKKEIIVGWLLLIKLKLDLGDNIIFKFRSYNGSEKYYKAKIVGTFNFGDNSFDSNYIIIPYNILHKLTGFSDNQTQKIHVFTKANSLDSVKENLRSLTANIVVKSWLDNPFVFAFEAFKVYRFNLSLSFVIVAAFLLVLTILMVIKERMKEIGIISAMGMSRMEIVSMFFYEGVIISLIGGFLGTTLMFIWLYIFRNNPLIYKSFNPETGFEVINTMNFKFSIKALLWGFFFVSTISSLISIIPSLKAATIKPIDAIRGE